MHVDQFIDSGWGANQYARWFFMLHRFPAAHKTDFNEWISQYKLFCTCEGKVYRVTGCSRMGDVWLAVEFERATGYDRRVDVAKCSDFRPHAYAPGERTLTFRGSGEDLATDVFALLDETQRKRFMDKWAERNAGGKEP